MEITKPELQNFKINPEDVWKEFNCPKYVTHLCFKTTKLPKEIFDFDRKLKLDTHRILQKLDELISDPVTSDSVLRICRLLFDFLNEVGDDGYKIKDLPLIIKVLKFLAENVKTVKEYKIHLNRMLELCNIPPLLEKLSDNLILEDIMKHYFTLLGHLLIILPTEQQILKIHRILHSLLLKTKIKNIAAIKLEYCRKAVEKSELPIIIAELLRTSELKMYEKVLQLVFLLSSISYECCYKMIEANILTTLLIRMDLTFATQVHCKRPPDMLLIGNEYSDETIVLIINILWTLMKSFAFSNEKSINLKNNLIPTHCALW
ncbi:cilia- and flagella-associated protein 69 [Apis mellifera caucasica]|uniref:Cilia- and flagella-associated protein 69 n=1 Tax=Apis mellifera TaxID=7460 RepID=A0A7M7SRY2_APIME|nr:cilia- and flagella-associated protein 69 [Apis mellifera]KAG6796258.1 cilia- and flagella-associated protein 69 [Apis mellifera caucasica]KAG9427982.1 cilia- and flagella-associated protein 69 [Apis mellifera carnica]|eukprot:XP_026301501.1 cilia- and flagella-associated protein 69 [Apis mellifera]